MNEPLLATLAPGSKRKRIGWIIGLIVGCLTVLIIAGYFIVQAVIDSGFTRGPDEMFGDQHLKTAVALVELHKVRYGMYPAKLGDVKFSGQWDKMALQSVAYYPNADR